MDVWRLFRPLRSILAGPRMVDRGGWRYAMNHAGGGCQAVLTMTPVDEMERALKLP